MLPKPTDPMETKTTPVHPLLVGTTPGPWTTRLLPTPGGFTVETNREYAGDRWWIADMGDSGHIGTEEREANAKLIAQAPSLAAENALLAEQVKAATLLLAMAQTWLLSHQDRPERALDSIEDFLTSLTPSSK